VARCDSLEQSITECCGLYGAGGNRPLASVCGELGEQAVLTPTTHDADRSQLLASQRFQCLDDPTVFQGQAFKATPHDAPRAGRFRLTRAAAVGSDRSGHICRVEEIGTIRIDQATERLGIFSQGQQFIPRIVVAFPVPLTAAFLEEP
jgi:hypothetical protein